MELLISEKQYWAILTAIFVVLTLCLIGGFWVFPSNTIGYDLIVGFLTSSVFMIFTIVFLSWLLNIRESQEWRIVRTQVKSMITKELTYVFDQIMEITKDGIALKTDLIVQQDFEKNKKAVNEELVKLTKSIELDEERLKSFLKNNEMSSIAERLSSIQVMYSKHLSADVVSSLMDLTDSMKFLGRIGEINQEADGYLEQAKAAKSIFVEVLVKEYKDIFLTVNNIKLIVKSMVFNMSALYLKGYDFVSIYAEAFILPKSEVKQ